MTKTNKRGRPRGSGKNEDLALMPKIADLMVINNITRTAAIRTLHPKAQDDRSVLRRIERKFKEGAEDYIAAAGARVVERQKKEVEARAAAAVLKGVAAMVLKPKDLADLLAAGQEIKRMAAAGMLPTRDMITAAIEGRRQYDQAMKFAGAGSLQELSKIERYARGRP